ncbi:MAG: alpha/beta hydrolase family protein [Gammaproteobacteria bacterium]
MHIERRKIGIDEELHVSSEWALPERCGACPGLILAHGAGNDMHQPMLSHVHQALADGGILTVKFNFPYKEAGRKAPDPPPRLKKTFKAVIERVASDTELNLSLLFLGGKSMGGRIASELVASGQLAAGLTFLGYPLHPAGHPDRLRVAHLERIPCPMLFIQGSRDPLCNLAKLEQTLARLQDRATLHVIQGGGHSFELPKRSGRSEREVWEEVVDVIASWIGKSCFG